MIKRQTCRDYGRPTGPAGMYSFFGFFADPAEGLAARCAALRAGSQLLQFNDPTPLLGVRFDPTVYVPADEDITDAVSTQIVALSRDYPAVRSMALRTECFGGFCSNWGFVARAGDIIAHEEGHGALRRLVAAFDVDLGLAEFFHPLKRDIVWSA